ncbi:small ribosomal subunit protein eS1-like [Wolffia australiana]
MSATGMDFTTDKLRSPVRKWQTLIEAQLDVKTIDSYALRIFSKRRPNQVKRTCCAQSRQIRQIRRKMTEIMDNWRSLDRFTASTLTDIDENMCLRFTVHSDYSEDIGVKVDRSAEEAVVEEIEVVHPMHCWN